MLQTAFVRGATNSGRRFWGAYEATLCAAILNQARTDCDRLFLTLLGGGAFGNRLEWILAAIRRSLDAYPDYGLNIAIVSYRASNPDVQQLVREFP